MYKEIETHNVFIDTSVFIKENYFDGSKIKALLKRFKNGQIEIFTTEITKNECLTHIEEDARHVVFHAQLLADFNTIEELGRKMLEELDR